MFKVGLEIELAQKIVTNIMKIVPYNINIMDKQGIIIASGNPSRLNKIHSGAIKALQTKESYTIYEDTDIEKKGINVPIIYKDEVVGVIGVSGEPNQVTELASIVKVTAELMIEKQFYDNKQYLQETQIREFLYDWVRYPNLPFDTEIQNRADHLNIDLKIPRVVVIIKFQKTAGSYADHIKSFLTEGEYFIRDSIVDIIILLKPSLDLNQRIENILKSDDHFHSAYVGHQSINIHASYESAKMVCEIAQKISTNKLVTSIKDFALESIAYQMQTSPIHEEVLLTLNDFGKSNILIETLFQYVDCGCDIHETCEKMFIHKNTLYYRLAKLSELTGYDTRHVKSLMTLYLYLKKNSISTYETGSML